jgi:chromosome segregation ATPase
MARTADEARLEFEVNRLGNDNDWLKEALNQQKLKCTCGGGKAVIGNKGDQNASPFSKKDLQSSSANEQELKNRIEDLENKLKDVSDAKNEQANDNEDLRAEAKDLKERIRSILESVNE